MFSSKSQIKKLGQHKDNYDKFIKKDIHTNINVFF